MGFADPADDKGNDLKSVTTVRFPPTTLPVCPACHAFVSNGLASHTTLVSGDRSV
jgi:hypothetical protein